MKVSIKIIAFLGGVIMSFGQSQAMDSRVEHAFFFNNGITLYFNTPVENVEMNALLLPGVCHEITEGDYGFGTLVSSLDVRYYNGLLFRSKVGTALVRVFIGPFSGTSDDFLFFLTKFRKKNPYTGADNDNEEEIIQANDYISRKFGDTSWVEYRTVRRYGGAMYDFATIVGKNAYARIAVTLINTTNFSGSDWQELARRDVLDIVRSWRVKEDSNNCLKANTPRTATS